MVAGRVPTSPTGTGNVLIHVLCASYMPRISLGGRDTAVNSILDEGLAVGSQSHETGAQGDRIWGSQEKGLGS